MTNKSPMVYRCEDCKAIDRSNAICYALTLIAAFGAGFLIALAI